MMFRGLCKVVAIAFVTNQALTTIFTYFVQQLDSAPPHQAVWIFSCVTCGMVTLWLHAGFERARQIHFRTVSVREIGPAVAFIGVIADGIFQQRDPFVQVAAGERQRGGEIVAQARQTRFDGECLAIRCDGFGMPLRHLQRVAEAKVRKSVARIELGNNGGEFDCVAGTVFFEQLGHERIERCVVEWTNSRRSVETVGVGLRRTGLPGCDGLSQNSQES